MIKVHIKYEQNIVHHLEITGHANSAEYGRDLVCAGVSSISLGALNALNHLDFIIDVGEGHIKVAAKNKVNQHDAIVLETMVTQLETIAENYPQFIKINK